MDLTEAEAIKKGWQEYTELYKKGLKDLDNHDGVGTHLEPNILANHTKGWSSFKDDDVVCCCCCC